MALSANRAFTSSGGPPTAGLADDHHGPVPQTISQCVATLEPISLAETNARAEMLKRIDNKYILTVERYGQMVAALQDRFSVLEINDIRAFTYRSCYYDDNFAFYHEHHQGKRRRVKVRTREYVDSGARFFEIKLKGLRGMTDKHRTECDFVICPEICGEPLTMLRSVYQSAYRRRLDAVLRPALVVGYRRCTLVARGGGERVTVDYDLSFTAPGDPCSRVSLGNNFIIVETKSADGKGVADRTLRRLHARTASSCSKYCLGVNLTGSVFKANNFQQTIRHARRNIVKTPNEALAGLRATSTL